jgi:mRNA export factor
MSLFTGATAASSTPNTTGDISKDVALNTPPEDSISELAFSPAADFLSISSWDNKVRIYQVNDQGQSEGKAAIDFQAPVLTTAWSQVSRNPFPPNSGLANDPRMVPKWLELELTREC